MLLFYHYFPHLQCTISHSLGKIPYLLLAMRRLWWLNSPGVLKIKIPVKIPEKHTSATVWQMHCKRVLFYLLHSATQWFTEKNMPVTFLHFNCHLSNLIVHSERQRDHKLGISSSELLLSLNEKISRNALKSPNYCSVFTDPTETSIIIYLLGKKEFLASFPLISFKKWSVFFFMFLWFSRSQAHICMFISFTMLLKRC